MRRNHRAIKPMRPFNAFPVSFNWVLFKLGCPRTVTEFFKSCCLAKPPAINKPALHLVLTNLFLINQLRILVRYDGWLRGQHKRPTGIVCDAAPMKCYPPPAPWSRTFECARCTV